MLKPTRRTHLLPDEDLSYDPDFGPNDLSIAFMFLGVAATSVISKAKQVFRSFAHFAARYNIFQ